FTESSITYNTLFSNGYWEANLTSGANDFFDVVAYPSFVNSEPTILFRSNALNSLVPPENMFVDGSPRTVPNATARDDLDGNDFTARSIFLAIGVPDIALPFTLLSFEVEKREEGVLTFWELRGEDFIQSIQLERSEGFNTFQKVREVSLVPGKGNYTYLDKEARFIPGQRLYYRLKIIDLQGRTRFSAVKEVLVAGSLISIYPNPVSDQLFIRSQTGELNRVEIRNAQGVLVLKRDIRGNQLAVTLSDLPVGMYWVRVQGKDNFQMKKIIIQH
ncbi:MAG: T9SS type A sorting domain-containing protein, partial [Bacteroidota bacterium]